jgi:hypothetical protein
MRSRVSPAIVALTAFAVLALTILLKNGDDKPPAPAVTPNAWVIRSWDQGTVTAAHEGSTYVGFCQGSYFFDPASTGHDKTRSLPSCELARALVGRTIQPSEGRQLEEDGRIVVMWSAGRTLSVRSWKDGESSWTQEDYSIRSVTANVP